MVTTLADQLLATEPVWVIGSLGYACTSLLWGVGWTWVGLVVAATAFPLRRWRLGHLTRRTPFDVSVGLLLLGSLVGMGVSSDRDLSWGVFQSLLACVLLYYSLVNMSRSPCVWWVFAIGLIGVVAGGLLAFRDGFTPPAAVNGFGGWVQQQLQHVPEAPRPSGMANPVMSTAHGLAIAVEMVLLPVIGLGLFLHGVRGKAAAVLASLPLLMVLLLLGSQGAWMAVVIGVAVLLVWRIPWGALPISCLTVLSYLLYREGLVNPASAFTQYGPANSLRERMDLWVAAAEVIRQHPVAGCGLGCLGRLSATGFISPHNAYLQFYADFGLAGALALLTAIIAASRMAIDLMSGPRDSAWYGFAAGIIAAAIAVGIHGVFEGAPAGIIAETTGGYLYIVSPVAAILAGLFVRVTGQLEQVHQR